MEYYEDGRKTDKKTCRWISVYGNARFISVRLFVFCEFVCYVSIKIVSTENQKDIFDIKQFLPPSATQ